MAEPSRPTRRRSHSAPAPLTVVTDVSQKISFVSEEFQAFTGFSANEVVGKRCDFLQGEGTDPEDKEEMRLAIRSKKETTVVVLNYRKDGTPFWNLLTLKPVFEDPSNKGSKLTHYIGDIQTIPIPQNVVNEFVQQGERPKLCYDDALALMRVLKFGASPPRVLKDDDMSETTTAAAESPLYRHQRYSSSGEEETAAESPEHVFIAETLLPTKHGRFRVRAYRNSASGAEPLAMIVGDVESATSPVLTRVHDQCVTSEVFGSLRCDCKEQLDHGLSEIQKAGVGILFYLPQEGRGIGLANKVAAYAAQELGMDTVDANRVLGLPDDAREYSAVKAILDDLSVESIKLMTNNPMKLERLTALGVSISERIPCVTTFSSEYALSYAKAKRVRMGHMFDEKDLSLNKE